MVQEEELSDAKHGLHRWNHGCRRSFGGGSPKQRHRKKALLKRFFGSAHQKFGYYYFLICFFSCATFLSMSNPDVSAPFKSPSFFTKVDKGMIKFVQVYETEEESRLTEVASGDSTDEWAARNTSYHNKVWITAQNTTSQPPQQIHPPDGYSFSSDWKIDVSSQASLDTQGWIEYLEVPDKTGGVMMRKRRRRWVRAIQPTSLMDATALLQGSVANKSDLSLLVNPSIINCNSSKSTSVSLKKKRKKKTRIERLVQAIENDFRFKGFGWSFAKSVLFKEEFGVGLRIPISLNFDSIERCPYIPVVSSSCSLNYPWTAAAALSVSLPCEVLRHVLMLTIQFIQRWVLLLTLMTTSVKSQVVVPPIHITQLRFSKNVVERIEIKCAWRISKTKGYEFKVTSSYIYLPTMAYLHQTLATAIHTVIPSLINILTKQVPSEPQAIEKDEDIDIIDSIQTGRKALHGSFSEENKIQEWLRERSATLGLEAGYPIPDFSRLACNLVCNLSGYYYSIKQIFGMAPKKKKKQSQSQKELVTALPQQQQSQTSSNTLPIIASKTKSGTTLEDESKRKNVVKIIEKKLPS